MEGLWVECPQLIVSLKFCGANSQGRSSPTYLGVSTTKFPYIFMVVCLAACGGGSSSGLPCNTTGDRGTVKEVTSYCSSDSNVAEGNVVSVCGTFLDSAIATAKEESDIIYPRSL